MSLFSKIFTKKSERIALEEVNQYFQTLTAYAPTFHSWGGGIYESELVRAAIDAIARNVSKLKIEIEGNSTISRLKYHPNEFQTWSQFMYRLVTIWLIHNTAFIVPIYDRYGLITGIYPVLPSGVTIVEYQGEPWLRYQFYNRTTAAEKLTNCAVLIRHQYKDDFFGDSNSALFPTMELINLDNQGIQEAVKNSATFRFMAQMVNFGSPEKVAEERKNFSVMNMKAEDEAGGMLLFPNTWKEIRQIDSKPYTVDPAERAMIQKNVYDYFGVNEDIIQSKCFGDSWVAFYESVVEPFAIQFSEVITRMLFTEREIAFGSIVMATANRLQYMSNKEKLDVSAQLADRGILNRDEVREIWNLPPLPDGEGQAYIIRGEYWNASEKLDEE